MRAVIYLSVVLCCFIGVFGCKSAPPTPHEMNSVYDRVGNDGNRAALMEQLRNEFLNKCTSHALGICTTSLIEMTDSYFKIYWFEHPSSYAIKVYWKTKPMFVTGLTYSIQWPGYGYFWKFDNKEEAIKAYSILHKIASTY